MSTSQALAKPKLGIVIVNFKTPKLTMKCVESIVKNHIAPSTQIVVVENASPDDSYQQLAHLQDIGVVLIRSETNGGFSAGVNLGVKHCHSEYVLVLNPDTYFLENSVLPVLHYMDERQDVGIVGLDLTYPNGARQYTARRFYTVLDIMARRTVLGEHWPLRHRIETHMMFSAWEKRQPFAADWVMGTGFIIRRSVFNSVGTMDESYFLYMEDVDLCARVWLSGYKVIAYPGAKLIHDHQRSSAVGPFSWGGKMHLRSLSIFRRRYRIPLCTPPNPSNILNESARRFSVFR